MSIFDDYEEPPKTKKLSELVTAGWVFPTDYPVVDNNNRFDLARATLKASIAYSVTEYYKDHRICSFVTADFDRALSARLYKTMSQHQYWIDQFLRLIEDNQFFYNEEWNDGGSQTTETGTNSNTRRQSDTPQNFIGDIANYLTEAEVNDGSEGRNSEYTTDLHVKRSTLGDITVQFRNFANFPTFMDTIIESVRPCFINYYGDEDIDFNGAA